MLTATENERPVPGGKRCADGPLDAAALGPGSPLRANLKARWRAGAHPVVRRKARGVPPTATARVGILGENCPHRKASLAFGRNEECGLRCLYHGWKFDTDGNVIDMPSEPKQSALPDKAKHLRTRRGKPAASCGPIWGLRPDATIRDAAMGAASRAQGWRSLRSNCPATGRRSWKARSTPRIHPRCTLRICARPKVTPRRRATIGSAAIDRQEPAAFRCN